MRYRYFTLLLFALACNASVIEPDYRNYPETQSRLCGYLNEFYESTQHLLVQIDYSKPQDPLSKDLFFQVVNTKTPLCDEFKADASDLFKDACRLQRLINTGQLELDQEELGIFQTVVHIFLAHYKNQQGTTAEQGPAKTSAVTGNEQGQDTGQKRPRD